MRFATHWKVFRFMLAGDGIELGILGLEFFSKTGCDKRLRYVAVHVFDGVEFWTKQITDFHGGFGSFVWRVFLRLPTKRGDCYGAWMGLRGYEIWATRAVSMSTMRMSSAWRRGHRWKNVIVK
jgi:hypothetical protein